jgi:hypothetical protein
VSQLVKFPTIRALKPKRNTILISLRRHLKDGRIERVRLEGGKNWAYRLLRSNEALAFLNDDPNKSWLKVPPIPPEMSFQIQNRHRVTYLVQLSKSDLEVARSKSEMRANKRTGGTLLLRHKAFTLSVSAISGRGQIWLFSGWDAEVRRTFSAEFYQQLSTMVGNREGQEHISVPIEFMGRKIRLGGGYALWAGSHYPIELDIVGKENDKRKTEALAMLTDQAKFNDTLLQIRDDLDRLIDFSQKQTELNRKQMDQLVQNEAKIVTILNNNTQPKPTPEPEYKPETVDERDISYG